MPLTAQILERLRTGSLPSSQELVVRLDPPQLGTVRLTLQADGRQISAVMEVDNPETAAQIRKEAPFLINHLSNSGLQVQRMDVVLIQGGLGHFSAFGQAFAGSGDGRQEFSSYGSAAEAETSPSDGPAEQGAFRRQEAGGLVNVWV
jgi:hypothetical protein